MIGFYDSCIYISCFLEITAWNSVPRPLKCKTLKTFHSTILLLVKARLKNISSIREVKRIMEVIILIVFLLSVYLDRI